MFALVSFSIKVLRFFTVLYASLLFSPCRCSQQLDLPNKIAYGKGQILILASVIFFTLCAASAQSCLNSNWEIPVEEMKGTKGEKI